MVACGQLGRQTGQRERRRLVAIAQLQPGGVLTSGNYDPATKTTEYRVIASATVADGCFHKMAGVLSAKRLEILSATIETTVDGTVVDRWYAPSRRWFKVAADDGDSYILRHDELSGEWELAAFTSALSPGSP